MSAPPLQGDITDAPLPFPEPMSPVEQPFVNAESVEVANNVMARRQFQEAQLQTPKEIVPYDHQHFGVVAYDDQLVSDPDKLLAYFFAHAAQKPGLVIEVVGYHVVHRRTKKGSTTRRVTDWSASLDVSKLVEDQFVSVKSPNAQKSVQEHLKSFCDDELTIKQIQLDKFIAGWNLAAAEAGIIQICRTKYQYMHNIDISYVPSIDKIIARSSSMALKMRHNLFANVLCVLSCLWIFAVPAYYALPKRVDESLAIYYQAKVDDVQLLSKVEAVLSKAVPLRRREVVVLTE